MRVALLTHSMNPRGGVVHTLSLGDALQAQGHAVTVFAPASPGQRMFRETLCRVVPVLVEADEARLGTADRVAARRAAFVRALAPQAGRFDVWHAQDGIGANALADLEDLGRLDGFVRTVHHLDDFADPQLVAWQTRSVLRARRCLCVSRLWVEHLMRHYGVAAEQVDNGVDLARYTPGPQPGDAAVARRLGLRPGAPLVLAVGGVEARKNTRGLLDGFALLRRRWQQAQLVVAGGASLLDHGAYGRAFDAALAAQGLRHAVRITGPLADADMPALYRLADVLAMPSLHEGFGLVVLEALASGTPVVASRIAPFTEHLADAPVHWCEPTEPASIGQALADALAAPAFSAPPPVCHRFDWGASAQRHASLYAHQPDRHSPAPCADVA